MDELATAAQRVARGDLTAPAEVPAPTDTLGQANAAMARQIVSVVQEVAAMKRSIAAAAEAMQSDAEELVSGTRLDSEQLRRAADRVSQITLQAHATATRATTLEHRSLDGAAIVRQGASAVHGSIDALREVCRKSAIVQELARNAGLVAVGAVSQASAAESAQQGVGAVEDEVRRLAAQAVEVSSELHRLSQAGVGAADESHLILERMGDSIHEGRSLVRELTATSRSHAAELLVIDEAVSEAHQLARRNAATARKLAGQVDSLASHSRRLDALLRRFHRGRVAATTSRVREPSGPVLYRSPASAFTPTPARRPRLAVIGK
jgi:methyl-accepting chemotaxis protein